MASGNAENELVELRIDTPADLRRLVDRVRGEGKLAFDTEFVSESTFEPVLCLIQIAAPGLIAAIDPIAVKDLDPFWDLVLDPSIELVMHAAGEDLRILKLRTGKLPERLFDVQIAAGLVGFGYPLSLGNVVHHVLGVEIAQGETRTDWRKRPLSQAQLRYALDDVRHLPEIADRLKSKLDELGRLDWAISEMAEFVGEIERRSEDVERWRRLPGIHQLNRRGLEMARRLFDWRLEEARRGNRPMRQVLRDDLLIAIAKRRPTSKRDLEALRDFNRPHLLSKAGEILDLIAAANTAPEHLLPAPVPRSDDREGSPMLVSLLSAALARCCADAGVSSAIVGSAQDLRDLIRWKLSGAPVDKPPALLIGRRRAICGDALLKVLEGRLALRVSDIESETPITLQPTGQDTLENNS